MSIKTVSSNSAIPPASVPAESDFFYEVMKDREKTLCLVA